MLNRWSLNRWSLPTDALVFRWSRTCGGLYLVTVHGIALETPCIALLEKFSLLHFYSGKNGLAQLTLVNAPKPRGQGTSEDRSGVYSEVNEHRTAASNAVIEASARCPR